ncbi:hypothetical protein JCM10213v2_008398 [Rhodosporidiobolus nylandii]
MYADRPPSHWTNRPDAGTGGSWRGRGRGSGGHRGFQTRGHDEHGEYASGGYASRGRGSWRGRGDYGGDTRGRGRGGYHRGGRAGYNGASFREEQPDEPAPPSRGPNGEYLPAPRRPHKDTATAPPVPPTETYLALSEAASTLLPYPGEDEEKPPVVVVSLAGTLLSRVQRNRFSSRTPVVRPYLSTFLTYLCGNDPSTGKHRFLPVVFSSARSKNVLSMLAALDMVPYAKLPLESSHGPAYSAWDPVVPAYEPRTEDGDVLAAVLARQQAGMNNEDFDADVAVSKDLARVWQALKFGGTKLGETDADKLKEAEKKGALRTVLLDEAPEPSTQQLHSHLPIPLFNLHDSDYPRSVEKYRNPSYDPDTGEREYDSLAQPEALDLDEDHPLAEDPHLLATIYVLERLRHESNFAAALRTGFLDRLRNEQKGETRALEGKESSEDEVDRALAAKGKRVCEKFGIEVRREWDPKWRKALLAEREKFENGEVVEENVDQEKDEREISADEPASSSSAPAEAHRVLRLQLDREAIAAAQAERRKQEEQRAAEARTASTGLGGSSPSATYQAPRPEHRRPLDRELEQLYEDDEDRHVRRAERDADEFARHEEESRWRLNGTGSRRGGTRW